MTSNKDFLLKERKLLRIVTACFLFVTALMSWFLFYVGMKSASHEAIWFMLLSCVFMGQFTWIVREYVETEEAITDALEELEKNREWFGYCSKCQKPWQMCEGCPGSVEVTKGLK